MEWMNGIIMIHAVLASSLLDYSSKDVVEKFFHKAKG
jgi:hypothetical protein